MEPQPRWSDLPRVPESVLELTTGPGSTEGGRAVVIRSFVLDGCRWYLAADLCRALGLHVGPKREVNVTIATRDLGSQDKTRVLVETDPGTVKPYTRMIAVSRAGMEELFSVAKDRCAVVALRGYLCADREDARL
jgi:hypothetical protein